MGGHVVRHEGRYAQYGLLVAALLILVSASPADAAGCKRSKYTTTCAAEDTTTRPGSTNGGGSGKGGDGQASNASAAPQVCYSRSSRGRKKVDCVNSSGYWSTAWNCRVSLADPQPPKSDPIWDGVDEGGAVYTCAIDTSNAVHGQDGYVAQYQRWSAAPPAGPAAPVDPEVLVRRAIARMGIPDPTLGTAPNQGKVGVVGMPAWFWVSDKTTTSGRALTASASDRGLTVRVRAELRSLVINPDDGGRRIRCAGGGVPFDRDNPNDRPAGACTHMYRKAGSYDVTANAGWVVTWTGGGRTGEISMPMSSEATIELGEAQVVSTR